MKKSILLLILILGTIGMSQGSFASLDSDDEGEVVEVDVDVEEVDERGAVYITEKGEYCDADYVQSGPRSFGDKARCLLKSKIKGFYSGAPGQSCASGFSEIGQDIGLGPTCAVSAFNGPSSSPIVTNVEALLNESGANFCVEAAILRPQMINQVFNLSVFSDDYHRLMQASQQLMMKENQTCQFNVWQNQINEQAVTNSIPFPNNGGSNLDFDSRMRPTTGIQ